MRIFLLAAVLLTTASQPSAAGNNASLQGKQEVEIVANSTQYTKSLNGGFAYSVRGKYATSLVVVQLNLSTGAQREIVAGNFVAVIRGGKYAGYLLVDQHRYYERGGSYECISVIRPDGKESFPITNDKAVSDANIAAIVASWPDNESTHCGNSQ